MFEDKNIQYVNITQQDSQLKVDNQVLNNEQIIKTNHSAFLVKDSLSTDAIEKLNILQTDINKTYLATLCESKTQKIVDAHEILDDTWVLKNINHTFNIAIEKADLEIQQSKFFQTGLDYIFSPFNILYTHTISHGANTNSINILILNNSMYALILDDEKRIVFSSIKQLTAFDDIQDSKFYEDELEGQQLFDEMHYLEIQENITAITNEFYEQSTKDIFCESIAIFYTVNQLTSEQITNLQDTLMLETEYSLIPLDNYIFNFMKQQNKIKISFISPREKKDKKSFMLFLIGALISTILVAGIFLYIQKQTKIKEELKIKMERIAKLKAEELAYKNRVILPNHKQNNTNIISFLTSLFDIIPDNAVLDELQINKLDSTFVCNIFKKDTFINEMKPKFLEVYKKSEVLLTQDNNTSYNIIIANSSIIKNNITKKDDTTKEIKYKQKNFLSKKNLGDKIQYILPKNSLISFNSNTVTKFTTSIFTISAVFIDPKDFFTFIESLNTKSLSMSLKYPIEFAKTKKGLETTFDLEINQFNKKKSIINK